MKVKRYPIQIWFLSDDLRESATFLTNKLLAKTISGCMNVLVASRFYYLGIRSPKFYLHYFGKERLSESLDKLFPGWPLRQKPSFNMYKSQLTRWCRMCKEHHDYLKAYLQILLDEYAYRYGKEHGLQKFADWLNSEEAQLKMPEGHLKKIVLPWKCLNPKYRMTDITAGYRKQYQAYVENDGLKVSDFKNRDVPDFLFPSHSQWMQ